MAKRVKCEKCGKPFYVNRVKRFCAELLCNTCFEAAAKFIVEHPELKRLAKKLKLKDTDHYKKWLTEVDFTPPDIFKSMDFKAAHQNDSKLESRELIVQTINRVFGTVHSGLSFLEFLGAGHGALYYAKNLHIKNMLLVEREKEDFDNFYQRSYREFRRVTSPMHTEFLNVDLIDHVRMANAFPWNVVNLDFCAYCYEYNNGDDSPLTLIEEFFSCGAVQRDASMLIASFMTDGYTVRIAKTDNKKIYVSEEEITVVIQGLAAKHGFKLEKVLSNKYDSTNQTTMINLGFVVR